MGDAQGGEGALEFRARLPTVGGGFIAEEGQTVGVEGQRSAVFEKGGPEVLEMMPGGVGGHEGAGEVLAGVVIDGEQQGLLGFGGPPRMDGGVVLPEFAHAGAFPSALGFGDRIQGADQQREVTAGVSRDGFAVAVEGEAGGQFVGDQLIIGRPLQGQEGGQEALNLNGPGLVMVATGKTHREGGGLVEPGEPKAEQVGATDIQKLGSRVDIEISAVECLKGMQEELGGESLGELVFLFRTLSDRSPASRTMHFVSLRYAPASSMHGPGGGVSF